MTLERTQLARLQVLLRQQPGFEHATLQDPVEPLGGGFWASLYVVHLQQVDTERDVVVRVMPDDALASKETLFQRLVACQGFPVPSVLLEGGRDSGLGAPFVVMDRASGQPLLAGLDGLAALRRLPILGRQLPDLLAEVSAQLHALDPTALRDALETNHLSAPWSTSQFLASLTDAAAKAKRPDLTRAGHWLAAHQPPPQRVRICHGDLHPFNVLVRGTTWTLLDWTAGLLAEPAYDLAFTTLLLRHPPLAAPAALRRAVSPLGAALAWRFVAAYRRAGGQPSTPAALDWYTNLHALRILVEVAQWQAEPTNVDRSGHPWMTLGPLAARRLSRNVGTPIEWTLPQFESAVF